MNRVPWREWVDAVATAVASVPDEDLASAARVILGGEIIVTAGNGGSATLASHIAQAIAKPSYEAGGGRAVVCLTDHTPTLTAHANDGGWASALVESARPYIESTECVLVLFSSSGSSENVVRLARLAAEWGRKIVAFTGFKGEPLRSLATVSLHVPPHGTDRWPPVARYEVVEPVHDALLHRVQYYLREIGGVA